MTKLRDGYFRQVNSKVGDDNYLLKARGGYIGLHTGRNNEANKVVRTDENGYIQAGWINTTSGSMDGSTPARIYTSYDGYIRYMTPGYFFSNLSNSGNNISITVGGQNRTLTVGYADNANKLDNIDSTGFLAWTGMSASGGSSAPFQTSVDFFNNTANLNAGARMIYNYPGSEYTILYTRRSDDVGHGSILRWGYPDNYIRMIRMISGSPQTSDWEKISAGYADSAGNADTIDGCHIGDLDLRYTRTGWAFFSPSDNSMTGSTDLQDWVTNMYNQGGYKGYSSITVGSWWWVRSLDFSSPVGTIRTSGAMIVYSGDGSSNKNYKHFLVLDAYADLYGITSNEESWKYYSKFLNNRNYTDFVYSKSTSDSRYLRKDTNDSTPYQYSFTKTNDHAIQVGTIRGRAVGSQTGEYIHLYERVAIGSPSGWGSRNAPTYGLATYGGAWLATDTGNVTIGGTNQLASAWGSFNLTVGKDTNKVVIGYLNSSTNGAVVGGHNNALSEWAPLNIAGTTLYFRINETIKATLDSNGNFGIGTTSPGAKLEVVGSGKFTNSLSANTGTNFNFYTDTNLFFVNKSLENWRASSYEYWVYLLIPVITTTNTSAMNFIEGTFNFWKTGGNVYDNVHVNLNCVYNVLEYSLMSYGQGTDWKLVRCMYNGVEYYALQGYYHANPYTCTNFCGHVNSAYRGGNNTTDKPLNLPYGVCYYYAPEGGNNQILNSEVYNSISTTLTTSVITSVNRRGLSNPGGFIGPLIGNATTASYPYGFTSRGTSDWSGVSGTFATDWSINDADIMFKYDGSKLNVITDGRFYQGIDIYGASKRVLDEYDISHTKWGDADTIDNKHVTDFYKSGRAYPCGKSDKPWHKVASFTQSISGTQINTGISFYVGEFYLSRTYGILNIQIRNEAGYVNPEFCYVVWSLNNGIDPNEFVVGHSYSGNIVTYNLYAWRSGWSSYNIRKIAEQAWGGDQDVWTLYDTWNGNSNCFANIPESNKYTSSNLTISNPTNWNSIIGKPSTYTPASHTHPYLPLSGGTLTGELISQNGGIWVQGGSSAGGNVGRMGLVGGMPTGLAYNTSKRGVRIYSNAIAFADPYNGNSNNDSGWIRHLETATNNGVLEIAVGDDADSEEIHFRYYNTSSNIPYDILVPRATGTLALTSQLPTISNSNGYVPKLISFPSYSYFGSSTNTHDYLKNIVKWIYDNANYGGSTYLMGVGNPNSLGMMNIQLYGDSGKNSEGWPRYCSGTFLNLGSSSFDIFGTVDYSYYHYSLSVDGHSHRITKLYRRDDSSDYSIQHYWTGSYWYLRGYSGDAYHAEVQVGYANYAGYLTAYTSSTGGTGANKLYLWHDWNNTGSLGTYFHGIWVGSPDGSIGYDLAYLHGDKTHLYMRSYDYGTWNSWYKICTNADTYVASDGTNRGIIDGSEVASVRHLLINGVTWNSDWTWSGQSGQPSWLWGSNDGVSMYVWNPSNFSVNYASSAGDADLLDGYHYNQLPYTPWKEQWIDMTGYSESYWHPVVTGLPSTGYRRIKVSVHLNSGTRPSWSQHSSGFTCNLDLLTTAHGWGTTHSETICLNSTYAYADQNPVGWCQLGNASHGILLLRGGGRYLVCTDWNASWTIYNQSITDYAGTQYAQTCGPYTSYPGIFNGSTTKNWIYAHTRGNILIDDWLSIGDYAGSYHGRSNNISGYAGEIWFGGNFHIDSQNGQNLYLNYYTGATVSIAQGGGNVGIGTDSPGYKLDVRGTTRSTDRIYANEWIQFDNATGLYWPNTYGAHFYPNDTSSYGQFRLAGSKNGYSGIHFGSGTGYLTLMDNGSDKGAYQENWDWLWYFNARNGKLSLRTSSDFGADINLNGSVRTNSTYYGYGLYHLSYGSSAYALTSDGGAALISSMSVNYADSAGSASSVTVNSSDSNSTYRMVWHSGNTLYGTDGIYCNPYTDYLYATSMNTSDWFRSSGSTGWYNESYGGGIYMSDSDYVRVYNDKRFYNSNSSQYAFYTPGGITVGSHLWGTSTASSWIDGQRYDRAVINVTNSTDANSFWPLIRWTSSSQDRWDTIGVLGNNLYFMSSVTSRTDNGYDTAAYFDMTTSRLYSNGLYHTSYGSSEYALTSDGGAARISSMSVNYANSAGDADTSNRAKFLETFQQNSTTNTYGSQYPIWAQWSDSTNVRLKCTNYTVWTDKANYANSADNANYLNQQSISSEDTAIPDGTGFAVYKGSTSATGGDGHIMSFGWSTGYYGAQIYIDTDPTYNISIRQRNGSGTWQPWKKILTEANYTEIVKKINDIDTKYLFFWAGSIYKNSDESAQPYYSTGPGFNVTVTRTRRGAYQVTVINNNLRYCYIYPMIYPLFKDKGAGSCYEHGFAYLSNADNYEVPLYIVSGGSVTFTIICGYVHTQKSWSESDFTKSNDDGGFICQIFASWQA